LVGGGNGPYTPSASETKNSTAQFVDPPIVAFFSVTSDDVHEHMARIVTLFGAQQRAEREGVECDARIRYAAFDETGLGHGLGWILCRLWCVRNL